MLLFLLMVYYTAHQKILLGRQRNTWYKCTMVPLILYPQLLQLMITAMHHGSDLRLRPLMPLKTIHTPVVLPRHYLVQMVLGVSRQTRMDG